MLIDWGSGTSVLFAIAVMRSLLGFQGTKKIMWKRKNSFPGIPIIAFDEFHGNASIVIGSQAEGLGSWPSL